MNAEDRIEVERTRRRSRLAESCTIDVVHKLIAIIDRLENLKDYTKVFAKRKIETFGELTGEYIDIGGWQFPPLPDMCWDEAISHINAAHAAAVKEAVEAFRGQVIELIRKRFLSRHEFLDEIRKLETEG